MRSTRTERALARPPVGRHRSVVIGMVLALVLVAVAAASVRDLAVSQGWSSGRPWLAEGLRALDGLRASDAVVAVGTVAAIVGLLLVLAGLLPARRRHVAATEVAQLWSTPAALAEVARTAADRAPGVLAARVARTGRGRVVVDVTTRGEESAAEPTVVGARDLAGEAGRALGARRIDVRAAQEDDA